MFRGLISLLSKEVNHGLEISVTVSAYAERACVNPVSQKAKHVLDLRNVRERQLDGCRWATRRCVRVERSRMKIEMKSIKTKDGWVLKEKRKSVPGLYERMLMASLDYVREPEYVTDIYGRVYEKEVELW